MNDPSLVLSQGEPPVIHHSDEAKKQKPLIPQSNQAGSVKRTKINVGKGNELKNLQDSEELRLETYPTLSRMHWFQVFNKKGEFTQVVAVEIGAKINLSRAQKNQELLGSESEAHTLALIPSTFFTPHLRFSAHEHARVKLRTWTHTSSLTDWLKSLAP